MWEDSAGQGMLRDCILLCDDGMSLEIASYLGMEWEDGRMSDNFQGRQDAITFYFEGFVMRQPEKVRTGEEKTTRSPTMSREGRKTSLSIPRSQRVPPI